jgi:hypothetical protein
VKGLALRQHREDAVEILARVGERPWFEGEAAAHRAHQFDVEPSRGAVLHRPIGFSPARRTKSS